MASTGARLHRTGCVFSRIRDLLKCNVIAYDDRPLWYDIYEAFPPIREPKYIEDPGPDQLGLVNVVDDVRPIFYQEDWTRANFLTHSKSKEKKPFMMLENVDKITPGTPAVISFIDKFQELQKDFPDLSKEEIFEKAMNEQPAS